MRRSTSIHFLFERQRLLKLSRPSLKCSHSLAIAPVLAVDAGKEFFIGSLLRIGLWLRTLLRQKVDVLRKGD